jgi:hypothetical protein
MTVRMKTIRFTLLRLYVLSLYAMTQFATYQTFIARKKFKQQVEETMTSVIL